jgi:hypothetical protein
MSDEWGVEGGANVSQALNSMGLRCGTKAANVAIGHFYFDRPWYLIASYPSMQPRPLQECVSICALLSHKRDNNRSPESEFLPNKGGRLGDGGGDSFKAALVAEAEY